LRFHSISYRFKRGPPRKLQTAGESRSLILALRSSTRKVKAVSGLPGGKPKMG
jgi:hypothetical protein